MNQYFSDLLNILKNSLASIDETAFERLVSDCGAVLESGKKIIASGLGKNTPICEKFVGTMTSLGMSASCLNTNSAAHGDIGMVCKGDLVIIITKSGMTAESVYLYRHLITRGCKIWLLSFERDSTLAGLIADKLIISLDHEGDMWDIVPNNSTTLTLIVLQALAIRLAAQMDISIEQFRQNHPGGHIGEILEQDQPNHRS